MLKSWQAFTRRGPGFSIQTISTQNHNENTRHCTSEYDDSTPLLYEAVESPLKRAKTAPTAETHISDQERPSKKEKKKKRGRAASESVLTEWEIQYRHMQFEESKVRAWSFAIWYLVVWKPTCSYVVHVFIFTRPKMNSLVYAEALALGVNSVILLPIEWWWIWNNTHWSTFTAS